jgi:protein-tyrosine phosphatase
MLKKIKMFKRQSRLFLKNLYESVLYGFSRRLRVAASPKKIVFVCKGNICRSAFAEYLLRSETKGKLLSIDSCGLDVNMRASSPWEALNAAKKFGLDLEDHLSKGWENCDLENADMILAMEFWQYKKLVEYFPYKKENIRLLREFTSFPENMLCNIYDPFGQSEKKFEKCFLQIKRSIDNINARV